MYYTIDLNARNRMRHNFCLVAVCALALGVTAADAGTLKPGLWEYTTTMSGMNTPQLSPDVLARMKAAGVTMPSNNSFTTQHCITPEQAASDSPQLSRGADGCQQTQVSASEGQVSFKMVCTGQMKGTGTVVMNVQPDQFDGDFSFTGTSGGHPVNTKTHISGHYVSENCPTK
jgi:hypothetical protein